MQKKVAAKSRSVSKECCEVTRSVCSEQCKKVQNQNPNFPQLTQTDWDISVSFADHSYFWAGYNQGKSAALRHGGSVWTMWSQRRHWSTGTTDQVNSPIQRRVRKENEEVLAIHFRPRQAVCLVVLLSSLSSWRVPPPTFDPFLWGPLLPQLTPHRAETTPPHQGYPSGLAWHCHVTDGRGRSALLRMLQTFVHHYHWQIVTTLQLISQPLTLHSSFDPFGYSV